VVLPSRIVLAVVVGALAVAGLLSATAVAGPATRFAPASPTSPAIAQAEQIARAYWGSDPCSGAVDVRWVRQAPDINALSTWATPATDPYGDPDANTDCTIDLNPAATFDWPKFCTVLVHEFGHLTGHDHDPRPGRLMSELYTTPLAQCTTPTARRGAGSRRLATARRSG
jgi:hypothetical protein